MVMQIASNGIARRGFIIGWDPLKLGNALSCVATLFILSRRTGVPTVYPYADRYGELFLRSDKLSAVHVPWTVDEKKLDRLTETLSEVLETVPHARNIEGSSFDELDRAEVKGVVWYSKLEGYLSDWRLGDAERCVKTFCRRGNGLVLQGSYWRQYMDMRELSKEGEALRRHLGPLRPKRREERPEKSGASGDVLRIGLHLRLGDYKIWLDGRFFFGIDAYRKVAERLHEELGERPHVFCVFSDQAIEPSAFAGLPVELSSGSQFDDFILLSECSYIVGPPSTFSTWSAFCGRARRIVLTRDRIDDPAPLFSTGIEIPFPTGAYLPGDERAGPI